MAYNFQDASWCKKNINHEFRQKMQNSGCQNVVDKCLIQNCTYVILQHKFIKLLKKCCM